MPKRRTELIMYKYPGGNFYAPAKADAGIVRHLNNMTTVVHLPVWKNRLETVAAIHGLSIIWSDEPVNKEELAQS